jgi:hypothetical protein
MGRAQAAEQAAAAARTERDRYAEQVQTMRATRAWRLAGHAWRLRDRLRPG